MKMQIKRNLMNILEKWASAPDFLIQVIPILIPTSNLHHLQPTINFLRLLWDLGLELGGRLGSAGHDPVLVYFSTLF